MNVTGWEFKEKVSVDGIYIWYIPFNIFCFHTLMEDCSKNSTFAGELWTVVVKMCVDKCQLLMLWYLIYCISLTWWRHTVTLAYIRGSEGIKSIAVSAEKLYWHSTKRRTRSVKFGGSGHSSWIFQARLFQLMILLCFSRGIWFMLCEQ